MAAGVGYRAIAFDLDGTLADTAALAAGKRYPAMVLGLVPPGTSPDRITFSRAVSGLPATLMDQGALVAIVTRSPHPYASTLCYLLGLDYHALLDSKDGSVTAKLQRILDEYNLDPSDLVYVGDLPKDREAAEFVGCDFIDPAWIHGFRDDVSQFDGIAERIGLLEPHAHPPVSPGSLLARLQFSCRTGQSISDASYAALASAPLPETSRSAIAWTLLRSAPAQVRRHELRSIAFNAVPETAYDCTIPRRLDHDLVGISRTIVRRQEYEDDPAIREQLFAFLRRMNEPRVVSASQLVDVPNLNVRAFRPFQNPRGGGIWRAAKDWRSDGGKGHSGPEPRLSLIELPALVLASHMRNPGFALVPAPSSPFANAAPGQVSLRLTHRAGALAGREVLDVLRKTDAGIQCIAPGGGRTVALVDDQLTAGYTARASVQALRQAGYAVNTVVTWSASGYNMSWSPPPQSCWLADPMWVLGRSGHCGLEHPLDHSADALELASVLDSIAL